MTAMEEQLGRAALEAMLERKPLHDAERYAAHATVCVIGGAGYIGSRVVARLLACAMTVHATRRAADDEAVVAALNRLPGAAAHLHWFEADLAAPSSLDAAMAGCKYVVHCAGVVAHSVPQRRGYKRVIEPTIKGVENVLGAVERTSTVERVVLTSSLGAVSSNFQQHGAGHVYSEKDWNSFALSHWEPYYTAKVASEWHAWSLAGQQQSWRLVAVCPGNVIGPILGASKGRVPYTLAPLLEVLDGTLWPFIAPMGIIPVDLDDVAAAHVLAMLLPEARGRYLLCERSTLMTEMCTLLRQLYPRHKVPFIAAPMWATALKLLGKMRLFWIKNLWNKKADIDCSKAQRELGLSFIPHEQTLKDCFDRLIELGHLPSMADKGSAPAAPAAAQQGSAQQAAGPAGATAVVSNKEKKNKIESREKAAEAAAPGEAV